VLAFYSSMLSFSVKYIQAPLTAVYSNMYFSSISLTGNYTLQYLVNHTTVDTSFVQMELSRDILEHCGRVSDVPVDDTLPQVRHRLHLMLRLCIVYSAYDLYVVYTYMSQSISCATSCVTHNRWCSLIFNGLL
jgi:hypothetical protein